MSQFDFGTIDPNVDTGTTLSNDLNSWRDALHSLHRGAARPTYAVAGTLWADDSGGVTNVLIKVFDGTDDITLGKVNETANEFTVFHNGAALSATILSNLLEDSTPQLGGVLDTLGRAINESKGAAIASATTTNIWAADGNTVHVTGATGITSFSTAPRIGAVRYVIFDGAPLLTNSANLALPGGVDFQAAAGDIARVYADTTTQLDVTIHKKDGTASVSGSEFGSGTSMLFQQTAAPSGWTKQTTHDNKALRLQTGTVTTGGATPFATVFGSGKTTGSASPGFSSHSHNVGIKPTGADGTAEAKGSEAGVNDFSTGAAGSGSAHDHTLSLDLQFVDVIIATKD